MACDDAIEGSLNTRIREIDLCRLQVGISRFDICLVGVPVRAGLVQIRLGVDTLLGQSVLAFKFQLGLHEPSLRPSVNRLVIPTGVPIHFTLTSASVMNAFFIPQLGSMIYTMNGMATQLNLKADGPGTFMGLSAMFSGDG